MQPLLTNKIKVLLIDDDTSTGSILKNSIKNCDSAHFIGQAMSAQNGIDMMIQYQPDFVIIDLHINGSSGFDLLSWIKEQSAKTKVAIISNSLKTEYKMIAESLGADYFLDKQKELILIATIVEAVSITQDVH